MLANILHLILYSNLLINTSYHRNVIKNRAKVILVKKQCKTFNIVDTLSVIIVSMLWQKQLVEKMDVR